jgi:uncharacterized RDD family membrane protein YckC
MRCPSCGAEHSSKQCPPSATIAASAPALSTEEIEPDPLDLEYENTEMSGPPLEARPASRLIEFPGVTRRAMPQWRKELSERVREVQEKRARETALEFAVAAVQAEEQQIQSPQDYPPPLELLPQAETPEINPVLAAALRRIERAHQTATSNSYSRTATAVAVAPDPHAEADVATEFPPTMDTIQQTEPAPISERTHNLVVVQSPIATHSEPVTEKPKPKRLIADDANDPALSYLDSIRAVELATVDDRASLSTRVAAALLDVIAVGFLSLPVAALIELQDGNWHQPRIIGLMGGVAAVLMFLYATVSTALTGRTLGMRLLSLRAIDERTRLIPTGNQSAGRALVYLLSLATMGIGLLLAFARGEGKTAHDRLTRTAVVRD